MVVHLPMHTEILPPEEGEAEGCVQCQEGRKLVLFVTGKCHWGCDYCPLSENRRESPDMFANERRCSTWEEVIEEGHAMKATGTGITGGDPMLDPERSVEAIKQLKQAFGQEHHIHLYTSIPFKLEWVEKLASAGLDELDSIFSMEQQSSTKRSSKHRVTPESMLVSNSLANRIRSILF